MSKTIKELADSLGVSKTAIRNYMTEDFRTAHTTTNRNGSITIDSAGCLLIAETMGKTWNDSENTEKKVSENTGNTENITIPRIVWDALQDQLKAKDAQIKDLAEAIKTQAQGINKSQSSIQSAQALHAGTMQQLGAGEPAHGEEVAIDAEPVDSPEEEPAAQPAAPAEPVQNLSFTEKIRLVVKIFRGK